MDRGFQHYHEEEGAVRRVVDGKKAVREAKATGGIEQTFEKAQRWLRDHADAPFFLFIHTYEPHTPYTHHDFAEGMDPGRVGTTFEYTHELRTAKVPFTEEERNYIRALYDGDIRASDRYVGRFLKFLDEVGIRDETLVVVTADHGEELGEHFESHIFDHGHSLRDDLLLVPLVLHDPARHFRRSVVEEQVRLIDVLPTVADLLEIEPRGRTDGRSLRPLMEGHESGHRLALSGRTRWGPPRFSLRTGHFKLIMTVGPDRDRPKTLTPPPPVQLYDLVEDPTEKRNLVDEKPRVAKRLSEALQMHIDAISRGPQPPRTEVTDEFLLERLRSLGYVE